MSTLVIMGIGLLAWLGVCVLVVGVCRAAKRGDDALPRRLMDSGSLADTARRKRRTLRRGHRPPRTPAG